MDYHWFVLRKGVNLEDMPPFPLDEFLHQMPPKVRQVVAAVYLAKIVDFLQGRYEDELPRFTYSQNGRRVLDRFPLTALFDGAAEENSAHPSLGTKDCNSADGPDGVDRKEEGR
jgi:hypothetical protein